MIVLWAELTIRKKKQKQKTDHRNFNSTRGKGRPSQVSSNKLVNAISEKAAASSGESSLDPERCSRCDFFTPEFSK